MCCGLLGWSVVDRNPQRAEGWGSRAPRRPHCVRQDECQQECNADASCTAIQTNGCLATPYCQGQCWLYSGAGHEVFFKGCVTSGDQKTFLRPNVLPFYHLFDGCAEACPHPSPLRCPPPPPSLRPPLPTPVPLPVPLPMRLPMPRPARPLTRHATSVRQGNGCSVRIGPVPKATQ